ncbi:MAG: HDOD domain-containing protein [Thermodesulfobacteriota bacterium]
MDIPSKEDLVKNASNPKVLPFVAQKVLEKVNDENTTIGDMTDIIEKDQTITASILRISNSAFYGLRAEVSSLRQAILVLGLNAIKDLVITVSTKSQFKNFGITEKMLWDHAVGTGIAARLISSDLDREVRDVSFLSGLMHDFGKVVMNNANHEAYLEVMQKTYNENMSALEAEENIFGYNHTDVGSLVMSGWGFPPVYVEVLDKHHLKDCKLDEIKDKKIARSIACINLADNLCKALGIGYREPYTDIVLEELPAKIFLEITDAKIEELKSSVTSSYEEERAHFE